METNIQIGKRQISEKEMKEIEEALEQGWDQGRSHISRQICKKWDWRNSRGLYQDIRCRAMLRTLESKGMIELPARQSAARKAGYSNKIKEDIIIAEKAIECSVSGFKEIIIERVDKPASNDLYKVMIARYHYLGYSQGWGEKMRYLIYGDNQLLGCIGFTGGAYKIESRDKYIGWSDEQRQRNLDKVINNARFLILPWVEVKNLGSYILGGILKRVSRDWEEKYGHKVYLAETFVQKDKYRGTCYQASNWLLAGETKGRGRNDRYTEKKLPVKEIYVYGLGKRFREELLEGGR